jgi:hypothetical protein
VTVDHTSHHVEAVTVNHNTSRYVELMLRSLFAKHSSGLNLSVTVFDNDSRDDMTDLRAYAERRRIPVIQSGFTTKTKDNSHGEVLSRFVLEHPECTHYLFLDADVCFVEDDTLDVMLAELGSRAGAFGIGPRMSWDGAVEIPEEISKGNPDLYEARLHPCCALVRNTGVFRCVVREIGLSCAKLCWADGEEYVDTFKLMTKVMKTHGLRHIISSRMVIHFSCVSYDWAPTQHLVEMKARRRDALLREFRERDGES